MQTSKQIFPFFTCKGNLQNARLIKSYTIKPKRSNSAVWAVWSSPPGCSCPTGQGRDTQTGTMSINLPPLPSLKQCPWTGRYNWTFCGTCCLPRQSQTDFPLSGLFWSPEIQHSPCHVLPKLPPALQGSRFAEKAENQINLERWERGRQLTAAMESCAVNVSSWCKTTPDKRFPLRRPHQRQKVQFLQFLV